MTGRTGQPSRCGVCKVSDKYTDLHITKKKDKAYCIACCPCERHEWSRQEVKARISK